MGNPVVNIQPRTEPCRLCSHFTCWTQDRIGRTVVKCEKFDEFHAFETGCRYWKRERGVDDEEGESAA